MSGHPSFPHNFQDHFFRHLPFGYRSFTGAPPRVHGYGFQPPPSPWSSTYWAPHPPPLPVPHPLPPPHFHTPYPPRNDTQAAEDEHDVDDYEDGDDDNDDEEYHYIDEDEDEDAQAEEYLQGVSNSYSRSHLPTTHSGEGAENQPPFPSQPPTAMPTAMPSAKPRKRRASSVTAEAALSSARTPKRRRGQEASSTETNPLTHVDLSGDRVDPNAHDPIQATLQKQREEQVRAQQPAVPSGKSKLTTIQCTVCLEPPTDLTATTCGHVFCRSCLYDWLRSAERDPNRRPNCPACRKQLRNFRNTRQKDLVNLVFMKKST